MMRESRIPIAVEPQHAHRHAHDAPRLAVSPLVLGAGARLVVAACAAAALWATVGWALA